VVAAPGPSLTPEIAQACRHLPVIAVNDAARLLPEADVLYACDPSWWMYHAGCPEFAGEKWSSHGNAAHDNKLATADRFGINLIQGADRPGFSFDPARIHYGDNSGFQAINLAIHRLGGTGRVVLIGFDMRIVAGRRHFFGEHPSALRSTGPGYAMWCRKFDQAARMLPSGLEIINCTPGSALRCFPMMDLADALPVAA